MSSVGVMSFVHSQRDWVIQRMTDRERFLLHVVVMPSGCWSYNKNLTHYGTFNPSRGRATRAHRWSFVEFYGVIPQKGEYVLHTCDNPGCVNPTHLYLGDQTQNMADRRDRNRAPDSKGENNNRAQLTWDQVRAIRLAHTTKGVSYRALARQFSTTASNVAAIVQGRTWRE